MLIFGLFVMSAYLKLDPSIIPFEKQLVDLGLVDWCLAPYLARFIIALELALGIGFLQSNYLKKIVIPATALLLLVFCVHLSYTIYMYGNTGNCGCFGQKIPMTPLQALIKNIITLGILGWMYLIYQEKEKNSYRVLIIISLSSALALFVFFPFASCKTVKADEIDTAIKIPMDTNNAVVFDTIKVDSIAKINPLKNSSIIKKDKKDTLTNMVLVPVVKVDALCPIKKVSLYAPFKKFNDGIYADLDDGRKIVTLFSLECEHCMETAKKIGELSKKRQLPPTFFLFWGTEDQVENFFKVAQYRFPYKIIEPSTFFQLLGSAPAPPKVSVLCNGNLIADFDNSSFSLDKLEEALNK